MNKAEFLQACKEGDIQKVREYIAEGLDWRNMTIDNGMSPLSVAITGGHFELARMLFDAHPEMATLGLNRENANCFILSFESNPDFANMLLARFPELINSKVLIQAVKANNLAMVERILEVEPELSEESFSDTGGAVDLALNSGNDDMADLLFSKISDLSSKRDNLGLTVLHKATRAGNIKLLERLLEQYQDLLNQHEDRMHKKLLHFASTQENDTEENDIKYKNIVEFLLKKRPERAFRKDIFGETPLHGAVAHLKHNLVQSILRNNPELLLVKDKHGNSAFNYALKFNSYWLEAQIRTMEAIIDNARPNDLKELDALNKILDHIKSDVSDEVLPMILKLVSYGLEVSEEKLEYIKDHIDFQDHDSGDTLAHLAVRNVNSALLEKLKNLGANLTIQNYVGRTALHEAALDNKLEMAESIVQKAADTVNQTDYFGRTALHYATSQEMADLLKSNGANPSIIDIMGRKAIGDETSEKNDNFELDPALERAEVSNTLLLEAGRNEPLLLERLLERGLKMMHQGQSWTVLHQLIIEREFESALKLIAAHDQQALETPSRAGFTALHLAVLSNQS